MFPGPFEIAEPEPHHPDLVLWMALPEGRVLHVGTLGPFSSETFAESCHTALLRLGHTGALPPHARVRVPDEQLAAELEARFGGSVTVRVAPVPELEQPFQDLVSSLSRGGRDRSLFDGGASAEAVTQLFLAAEDLYLAAPWEGPADSATIRVDAPELGIRGACAVVIGGLGESLGFLVFPSLEAHDRFLDLADPLQRGEEIDFGCDSLALEFESEVDVPPTMLDEIEAHGLPVADEDAYPIVERRTRSGEMHAPSESDVWLMAGCARSLADFSSQYEDLLAGKTDEPVSISYGGGGLPEIRITYPPEAFELFEEDLRPSAASSPARAGRNDPCPCGSGRKYKRCCLDRDRAADAMPASANAAERRGRAAAALPRMMTPEGDEILLTVDRFAYPPERRGEVEERLLGVPGLVVSERNGDTLLCVIEDPGRPGADPVMRSIRGFLTLEGRGLRVETLSSSRADEVRALIESHCGPLVRHRIREHVDPASEPLRESLRGRPPHESPPEAKQAILDFKARHYASWPDARLPALANRTPREAVRTAWGRREVDALLSEMEQLESRVPEDERFDFGTLRRQLGVEH